MKSLTSVLGWTLLVAVLAVPSFLFYNWWNKSRQQAVSEIPQEAAAQNIFPAQDKGAAAHTAQPAPAAQAPAQQPQAAAPVVQPKPQQPDPAPAAQQPAPREPSASAQAPAAAPAAQPAVSTAAPQAVQQSTAAAVGADGQKLVSSFKPRTDRDPTLSPDDYQRIKDAEAARKEAERQARMAELNRPKAPDITSRLHLQGIVGNAAIINGDMYSVGQSVLGAKLVKVGANYIIVDHKGKKYRKLLQ
jgi:cytoskeletal protein RodZ